MSRRTFLVFWLMLASTSCNYTNILWEHRCDAGSAVFACSIPDFLYIPGQNSSRIVEPNSTTIRRLSIAMSPRKSHMHLVRHHILAYDAALHNQLQRPSAIQLMGTNLELVEIPIDLEYGDFSWGTITEVVVPPSETPYPLRYLDLYENELVDVSNLSTLVNLETLILSGNKLSRFTNQVFLHMTNLTTLMIAVNRILDLSFSMFPPRLEKLYAHAILLQSVDFSNSNLPELVMVTLSHGFLIDIDINALLAAAPKLKRIQLKQNKFGFQKEKNISDTLKAAGVTHDESLGKVKLDPTDYVSLYDSDEDDDNEDSFYRDRMVQFWEHTFAWLLGIGNVIVIVWAAVGGYKRKQSAE